MLRVFEDLKNNRYLQPNLDPAYSLQHINGVVRFDDSKIEFLNTPIATPFGDSVLVKDLTFKVGNGEHLMITGSNGSGKSSILRILAGLWPQFDGVLTRPRNELSKIMYIPQRPYLAIGTLRDQVIYPHTKHDMKTAGRTDDELLEILKIVYLEYIPSREGGLDSVKEWKDVFSGGEKQRVQLARLFYHKPKFGIFVFDFRCFG